MHQDYFLHVLWAVFCLTIRIFIARPAIGPEINVMFTNTFFLHEVFDAILQKNETKDI